MRCCATSICLLILLIIQFIVVIEADEMASLDDYEGLEYEYYNVLLEKDCAAVKWKEDNLFCSFDECYPELED